MYNLLKAGFIRLMQKYLQFYTAEFCCLIFGSVQFSHSVVSDSLWPHGLQQTRPPCPSPTPGAYANSCSLSQWCHPAIQPSSSFIPFSSCLQSSLVSGSFQMSQFFASVQFSSVTQSCQTLCDPMNRTSPGLSVHHHLLEFTQTRPSSWWCHPTISFSVIPIKWSP